MVKYFGINFQGNCNWFVQIHPIVQSTNYLPLKEFYVKQTNKKLAEQNNWGSGRK